MPSERKVVSVHLISRGSPQSETKHGQIHHRHCHQIRPQWDSNPVLSSTSQLVADMRLSDHEADQATTACDWKDRKRVRSHVTPNVVTETRCHFTAQNSHSIYKEAFNITMFQWYHTNGRVLNYVSCLYSQNTTASSGLLITSQYHGINIPMLPPGVIKFVCQPIHIHTKPWED